MEELNDLSPMPFGKHKGEPMQDIPVEYLHWLWTKAEIYKASYPNQRLVSKYIKDNLQALKDENKDLIWS